MLFERGQSCSLNFVQVLHDHTFAFVAGDLFVVRLPHFCLYADYHTFVCMQFTTLLCGTRLPLICLYDGHPLVCETGDHTSISVADDHTSYCKAGHSNSKESIQ